jgi:hypothetical protein
MRRGQARPSGFTPAEMQQWMLDKGIHKAGGCIEWHGPITNSGYGIVSY